MTEKLIILDRDGVINHDSDEYIKSPEEWQPIEGSLQAIARLNNAGFRVLVATNQSGLARKLLTHNMLNRIHSKMHHMLEDFGGHIDSVFFCPHGPDDGCHCRKPAPGLLLDISARLGVSLEGVPFVGDSWRDLEAGMAAGAQPVLVKTGKGLQTLKDPRLSQFIPVFDNLAEFTDSFLHNKSSS